MEFTVNADKSARRLFICRFNKSVPCSVMPIKSGVIQLNSTSTLIDNSAKSRAGVTSNCSSIQSGAIHHPRHQYHTTAYKCGASPKRWTKQLRFVYNHPCDFSFITKLRSQTLGVSAPGVFSLASQAASTASRIIWARDGKSSRPLRRPSNFWINSLSTLI